MGFAASNYISFPGLLSTCSQLHSGSFDQVWDWSLGHGFSALDGHCIDLSLSQDHQQVFLRGDIVRQPGAGKAKQVMMNKTSLNQISKL